MFIQNIKLVRPFTWQPFSQPVLSAAWIVCGDSTCNSAGGENCYTCPKDCGCTGAGQCCISDSSIMHSDSSTGCANSGNVVWEYEKERVFCCEGKIGGQGTDTCCVNSDCKLGKKCVNKVAYGYEIKVCEALTESSKKLSINPQEILGLNLIGMSDNGAEAYDKGNSLSNYFGLGFIGYTGNAKSWEEIANYEFRKGRANLTNAKNIGLFDMLNWGIKGPYKLASFLDTISQLPKQMQKISEIKNVKELAENAQNIKLLTESTDGLASVTGTVIEVADAARGVKITKEDNSVFKAIKENGLWALGTAASGGWTLLADASNSLTSDNVDESILYETEIGELSMFMSIHANVAQKMAKKQNPTDNDLKEYFFSVKSYLKMKKLELALKYRDDVAVWKTENKGLFTKVMYFIAGASDTEKILAEKKAEYDSMNANYEQMEKNVDSIMQQYEVELK